MQEYTEEIRKRRVFAKNWLCLTCVDMKQCNAPQGAETLGDAL